MIGPTLELDTPERRALACQLASVAEGIGAPGNGQLRAATELRGPKTIAATQRKSAH
ncbi:MAG: hypothetical protein QM766_27530 [Burkholderiaceae bacterium]